MSYARAAYAAKKALRTFIFLDIDGVVHSWPGTQKELFLPKCMALVKKIASDTNAEIVLSSQWRVRPNTLATVEKQFALHGLPPLVGYTPFATCRAAEILLWLENKFGANAVDTCCFVALDDDDLVEIKDVTFWGRTREKKKKYGQVLADGHFVKTDEDACLTAADAEKAIQLLLAQQKKQREKKRVSTTTETSLTEICTPKACASASTNKDPSGDGEANNSSFRLTEQTTSSPLQVTTAVQNSFIFLGIDGVVHDHCYWWMGDPLQRVKKIASEANAQIVLSSCWRKKSIHLEIVQSNFARFDLPPLAGCTPQATCRATEICLWLENKFGVRVAVRVRFRVHFLFAMRHVVTSNCVPDRLISSISAASWPWTAPI